MSRPKSKTTVVDAKTALKAGSSFIASTWRPWPQEPSGAWDMAALDRRMSDGVSAVRQLTAVVKLQVEEIERLRPLHPSILSRPRLDGGEE